MQKIQIAEAHEIERTEPINLESGDRWMFEPDLKRVFENRYLLQLENAYVLHDVIFCENKFYDRYSLKYSIGKWRKALRMMLLARKKQFLGKGIWITDNWSRNYFHWLTDTLVRYEASRQLVEGHKVLLPDTFKDISFVQDSLAMLDISPHYFERTRPLKVKELLLPDYVSPSASYRKDIIGEVRDRLRNQIEFEDLYRRIYISREQASRRTIKNEAEVIELLQSYDFEVVKFEEISFREQIKISAESSHMVGLHGAGLTNMMFMSPDASIMELRAENDDSNNCYFSMASVMGLNYYYCPCRAEKSDIHESDVEVDIKNLAQTLDVMMKRV